jgi:hypothetical protein
MKEVRHARKRFSVEQIVAILQQPELSLPVADQNRWVGISMRTCHLYGPLSRCKRNWL